jgi:RimJ/RimL family protein N-acetyltransferase
MTGPLRGRAVELEPVGSEHVRRLKEILQTPEVRSRWGDEAASPDWPFDDPSAVRFAIVAGGAICGLVQYFEEPDPLYRHASIDIFVDPSQQRRGFASDALAALTSHLIDDRGHHRITIDPAADNAAAIRCYEKVGFRPVGVMHRYERLGPDEPWHDNLLMEMIAPEPG